MRIADDVRWQTGPRCRAPFAVRLCDTSPPAATAPYAENPPRLSARQSERIELTATNKQPSDHRTKGQTHTLGSGLCRFIPQAEPHSPRRHRTADETPDATEKGSTKPISRCSAEHYIGELKRFLRWLHKNKDFDWRKPEDFDEIKTKVDSGSSSSPPKSCTASPEAFSWCRTLANFDPIKSACSPAR